MNTMGMVRWLATAGYVGHSPWAPGTAGSLVGILLAWLLWALPSWVMLVLVAAGFWIGVQVSSRAEVLYGMKDSPRIVIDEVIGQMAALLFLPRTGAVLVSAFILFRIFDILKPFPARAFERSLSGGLGVMADDMAAAAYANLIIRVVLLIG